MKNGEDVRVKAESPVVDGLNAIKFMTASHVVARFENAEMRFYHEECDAVERHVETAKKARSSSRSKTSS